MIVLVAIALGLLAPASCAAAFVFSPRLYKADTPERTSAATLVVLAGMLAAIAIPIPVAASFLPDRNFALRAWFLAGALLAAIGSMLLIVISMIKLQSVATFAPQKMTLVPGSINAAWIALILLAFSSTLIKVHPARTSETAEKGQVLVAHDLLSIGVNRGALLAAWGAPAWNADSQVGYHTQQGITLFCLDDKSVVNKVIQTKETNDNAVRTYCK
jgi:hypothetical protein